MNEIISGGYGSLGKDGASAGAVDEEDFIKSFEDVPAVQVMCT